MPQRGPERQSVDPADHSDGHKGEAPALRTPNLHYYPFTRHHSQSLLNKASSYHGKTWVGWMLAVQRQGLVGKGQEAPCDTLTQQTKFSNTIKGRDICTQVWIRVWWYIPGLHWRDFYLQSLVWWNKGKYWGTDTTWGSVKGRIFQRAAVLEQPHYQGLPGPEKSCPRWRLTAGLCPGYYQNGLKNINHMIMIIPIDVKGPCKRPLGNIKQPFMVCHEKKRWTDTTHVNIIKAMFNKPITNIMVSEKTSVHSAPIQYRAQSFSHRNKTRERNKRNTSTKKGKD